MPVVSSGAAVPVIDDSTSASNGLTFCRTSRGGSTPLRTRSRYMPSANDTSAASFPSLRSYSVMIQLIEHRSGSAIRTNVPPPPWCRAGLQEPTIFAAALFCAAMTSRILVRSVAFWSTIRC